MKKRHPATVVLFFFSVMTVIFTACDDPYSSINGPDLDPNMVTSMGGTVYAMNRNVMLIVPYAAVVSPVKFIIYEYYNEFNYNLFLKMVVIEPIMDFKQPIIVKLRYDGDLANGTTLCESMNLTVYYWDDPEDYITQEPAKQQCCMIDRENKTIDFCITRTGFFAVAVTNNGGIN